MKGKRFFSLLLALVLCIGVFPATASAANTGEYGDLAYTIKDGKVTITDCVETATSVTIPATIEGYPVTSIGNIAFEGCTALTDITIPDSVTCIGWQAFYGCTALTGITIPKNVTDIGNGTFAYCSELERFAVADDNTCYSTDSYGALLNAEKTKLIAVPGKIRSYSIPTSIDTIAPYVFAGCKFMTSVTIPDSVTSIGNGTFEDCAALTGITIPDGVTSIENNTFYGCTALTGITIPNSVTSIGNWAFYKCSSLTDIVIPDSITSIGYRAFTSCTALTDVTIPDSVTCIGYSAFSRCTNLTDVTIQANDLTLSNAVFAGCKKLKTLIFEGNTPTFEENCFGDFGKDLDALTATAYYPKDDPTWTEKVRQNYGGNITWVAYSEGETPWETPSEHEHSFTTKASDRLASAATCTAAAKYYVQCDNCDTVSDTLTVSVGKATNHDFSGNAKYCKNGCATKNPNYTAPVSPSYTPVRPTLTPVSTPTPVEPEQPQNPFTDISKDDYFFDAVIWAAENGITSGTSETTFEPNKVCTRAGMAIFLWRSAGKPEPISGSNPFTDVTENDDFYKAVLWAVENGITKGTSATHSTPATPAPAHRLQHSYIVTQILPLQVDRVILQMFLKQRSVAML